LASEPDEVESVLGRAKETTWADVACYLEQHGSSTFVRNIVGALTDLYDLGEEGLTEDNWQRIDLQIRENRQAGNWAHDVIDRANVRYIVTDPYGDPLIDARKELGERYSSVLRINALAMGWHGEAVDHNGNSACRFAEKLGVPHETFEDHLALIERLVDTMGDRHQVALKNALAYDREINFDHPDEHLARQAWGNPDPSPMERKAFGDVVVDYLCELAGERDIPVQMHLGSAQIRGSNPMNVAGLIERHPRTRFLLMHLGYPWSQDVLGMAMVYRNVWLDLTWSWLLSPSYFRRVFHEAIEVLPDESRMMLGGDNWHAEETFGTLSMARRLIGEVLDEKVKGGYFKLADARRLARKILHDNAIAFFGLPA
jgi:predicted TIM-barrel fold metal-dependent hydrolase